MSDLATTPTTAPPAHDVHVTDRTYLKVFLALLFFTVLEYVYAHLAKDFFFLLVAGLVAMAVTKAILVALFFMHLKFEGRWVYLLVTPALFFATVLVLALYPDIGIVHSPPGPPAIKTSAPPRITTTHHLTSQPRPSTG